MTRKLPARNEKGKSTPTQVIVEIIGLEQPILTEMRSRKNKNSPSALKSSKFIKKLHINKW
jgi:hypothetical protein